MNVGSLAGLLLIGGSAPIRSPACSGAVRTAGVQTILHIVENWLPCHPGHVPKIAPLKVKLSA